MDVSRNGQPKQRMSHTVCQKGYMKPCINIYYLAVDKHNLKTNSAQEEIQGQSLGKNVLQQELPPSGSF